MTANVIKELFEQGKYQEVVDLLSQWETDGTFDTFTEKEQIECIYYKSSALGWGLVQREEALQIILTARKTYAAPNNRSLILALLTQQIYTLCLMNRLDEAFEVITEGDALLASLTANERETGAYWIAYFEQRKGFYYFFKKDTDTALEYTQHALALREGPGDLFATAHALGSLGEIYSDRGELDTALDYFKRALSIFKQLGNLDLIAYFSLGIGGIYRDKGEWNSALDYYQQALSVYETLAIQFRIAYALWTIADLYWAKGELNTALEYNHRSLSLSKSAQQFRCFLLFAWIYFSKGELNTALDYIQQSLASRVGPPSFSLSINILSALIYHAQGELDKALEQLQQGLSESEKMGGFWMSVVFFQLIHVNLDQNNRSQAQEYLTQLQQLQAQSSNPYIHLHSRLAEALVLKQSPRVREKFQAQTILEQIVKEEVIWFNWTALAMVHLCELLIAEVKFYGEPDVWEEAKALIDKLYGMAQDQHSVALMCEALLLRAKFAAVDGKLPQAQNYYEQARLTATEKNLTGLLAKVDTEQKRFEAEFETWQNLIQSNVSLQKRLNHARMDDYIKQVQQRLKMDMPRQS
ncbi:MAG: tetratricopeptide repeat protein [Candidatus Hermodarchaeota archaeon]